MLEHRAVRQRQTRRAVHERSANGVLSGGDAEVESSRAALVARTARRDDAERDSISGRDVRHALADGLDDPGTLMAEHHGPPVRAELAIRKPYVRVADACGRDADEHLAGLG